jgi:hypothetical protein
LYKSLTLHAERLAPQPLYWTPTFKTLNFFIILAVSQNSSTPFALSDNPVTTARANDFVPTSLSARTTNLPDRHQADRTSSKQGSDDAPDPNRRGAFTSPRQQLEATARFPPAKFTSTALRECKFHLRSSSSSSSFYRQTAIASPSPILQITLHLQAEF